jgi:hypothetical protein
MEKEIPEMERRYGVSFEMESHDILTPEGYAECRERLTAIGREFRVFPVLFVGNSAYQGNTAVQEGLEAEIVFYLENGVFRPQAPATIDGSTVVRAGRPILGASLRIFPVFLAGLADGINPCAFATMLFLVSLLTLFGKSKREVLLVGSLYAATIFVTYFALGVGILTVLRRSIDVSALRLVLRVVVSISGGVFGVLSLRDAVIMRGGRSQDATLQLSNETKQRVHRVIRRGLGTGGLIFGTVGAAFIVSLLELACTGQLYLPTIAYLPPNGVDRGV